MHIIEPTAFYFEKKNEKKKKKKSLFKHWRWIMR